jgi:hypothetical protein
VERAREAATVTCPLSTRSAPEPSQRMVRSVDAPGMAAVPSSKVPARARGTGPLSRLNQSGTGKGITHQG